MIILNKSPDIFVFYGFIKGPVIPAKMINNEIEAIIIEVIEGFSSFIRDETPYRVEKIKVNGQINQVQ